MTFDGTTVRLYINGSEAATEAAPGTLNHFKIFGIGRRSTDADYFNGSIDEIRIYGDALTAQEIKALYLNPGGV